MPSSLQVYPTHVGMNREIPGADERNTVYPTHVGMNRFCAVTFRV